MREALYAHLLQLEADETCGAIVLSGAGGNFCSGGDISEMKPREILEGRVRVELATRIFRLLATGPKPIVTAVEGRASGCGVSFVAASDYAVAASNARFSCAFIKVGLMADFGGIWSIARRVGQARAMEMCAFGDSYDSAQALQMNLINQSCAPGMALDAALQVAERFAANPPIAMALLRAALNSGADTLDQAVATEINSQSVLLRTEDFAEATRAFMEKREPHFTGR
jgi:enoyl-CoA hydratase/carnithine racemase